MRRSKRLRVARVLVISAVSLLAAWACGGSDEEKLRAAGLAQGCSLNSQCENPLVCTFERCHSECETDRDCNIGEQRCVRGPDGNVCQLTLETDCTKSAAVCKGSQVCGVDGECRDTCSATRACPADTQECAGGECVSVVDGKDARDDEGNIIPDSFRDPIEDVGVGGGSGGSSSTGKGGATGNGGATGKGGSGNGQGGTVVSGGSGPEAGGTGGPDTGDAGAPTSSGGAAGSPTTTTGGATGSAGAPPIGCEPDMADCDNDPSDCETPLTLQTSCGACDVICDPRNGVVSCNPTTLKCEVSSCTTGFSDCNEDGTDGCEAELAVDSANCGECGKGCGGGSCNASQCGVEIVMKPDTNLSSTGEAFLVGDQIVKLNTNSGTEIRTVTLPPTAPPEAGTALVTSPSAIYGVYADTTNIYWSLTGSPGTILWKPLAGGAAKTAVNMPASSGYASIIRGNTTALFMVGSSPNAIYTAPRPTASSATATAGLLSTLTGRSPIQNLVIVGSRLFWLEGTSPQAVYSAPLTGTPVTLIDDTIAYANSIGLTGDGTHAYWTTSQGASSKVRRVAAATATAASVEDVAVGLNTPGIGLAVDESYAYFFTSYQVWRVTKDQSAEPESLGNFNRLPYFYNLFAVDDTHVYGTGNAGEIVRLGKTPTN